MLVLENCMFLDFMLLYFLALHVGMGHNNRASLKSARCWPCCCWSLITCYRSSVLGEIGAYYLSIAYYLCIFLNFKKKRGGAYYNMTRIVVRHLRYQGVLSPETAIFFNCLVWALNQFYMHVFILFLNGLLWNSRNVYRNEQRTQTSKGKIIICIIQQKNERMVSMFNVGTRCLDLHLLFWINFRTLNLGRNNVRRGFMSKWCPS